MQYVDIGIKSNLNNAFKFRKECLYCNRTPGTGILAACIATYKVK